MKKVLFVMAVLAVTLGIVSCKGGSAKMGKNATPTEAAVAMWKLVQDGNYVEALKLNEGAADATDEELEQMAKFAEALYASVGGVKEVEPVEETLSEDGQKATVKLKLTYGNGDTEMQKERLVMTEDGWRPAK